MGNKHIKSKILTIKYKDKPLVASFPVKAKISNIINFACLHFKIDNESLDNKTLYKFNPENEDLELYHHLTLKDYNIEDNETLILKCN